MSESEQMIYDLFSECAHKDADKEDMESLQTVFDYARELGLSTEQTVDLVETVRFG